MTTARWALLAVLLATIIWGAVPAVAKYTFIEIPPFVVAFIRFAWAAILFLPILGFQDKFKKVHLNDYPLLFLLAILGITLSIGLFFVGLSLTSALDAGIIIATGPLINSLGARLFLRETISRRHWTGTAIACLGTLVIVILQPILEDKGNLTYNILGNVLLLIAVISNTAYTIISKESFKKFDASIIIGFSFVIGAFTFLPFALWETYQHPTWASGISIESFWGLAFLAIFASLFAYFIYEWALEKLPISKTLPMTFIQPIVTIIIAVPLLHEKINNLFIVGSILILVGMYLATFDKPHHHLHSAHHKV